VENAKSSALFMETTISASESPGKPKFLEEVRRALRMRHYSIRTEQTYLDWIRQFIVFHGKNKGTGHLRSYHRTR
jgi:hypothetical protein